MNPTSETCESLEQVCCRSHEPGDFPPFPGTERTPFSQRELFLFDILRHIRESTDLRKLLPVAVAGVRRLLNADRTVVFRFQPNGSCMEGSFVAEDALPGWVPAMGEALSDRCFSNRHAPQYIAGKTQAIADVQQADLHPCYVEVLTRFQIRANLVVPIAIDGELWGLLCVHQCSAPRQWTPEEIQLVAMLAAYLEVALQQAQWRDRLHQSEARLQKVAANVPGVIYQFRMDPDSSTCFTYASAGSRDLYELEPADMNQASSMAHPDDRRSLETSIALSAQTLKGFTWEGRIRTPSGNQKWIRAISRPESQPDGSILWDGLIVDVTEQHAAQQDRDRMAEALKRERMLLHCLVNSIPDVIYYKDRNGVYLGCNKAFEELLGREESEIIGRTDFSLFPNSEDVRRVRRNDRLAIKEGRPRSYEEQATYPDGRTCYFETLKTPFLDEAGNVLGLLGVSRDITDRKSAIEALRRSEAQNRAILGAIPDLLLRVKPDGICLDFIPPDSNSGHFIPIQKHLREVLPSELLDRQLEAIARACETGRLQVYEHELPKQGKPAWEEVRICASGENEALVMVRDITERKQAELQVQQRTRDLEHTLRELWRTQARLVQSEKMSSLGQLVAGIAHEINNPVSFIYGNINPAHEYVRDLLDLVQAYQYHYPHPPAALQELIDRVDLDFLMDDLPKLLESMQMGAQRIREIVASLRNFSRLDEAEVKEVNLHDGINSTLTILQHRLKGTPRRPAIQVVKDFGNLPPVECYPGQLNQVFMNILANAIDALEQRECLRSPGESDSTSSKDSEPGTIEITTRPLQGIARVQICISDNGSGIPADIQHRIFDPFFTTKEVGKGTGLGMSISYQIVTEKHGGTLECISEPGRGTTFIIEVPRKQFTR